MTNNELEEALRAMWKNLRGLEDRLAEIRERYDVSPGMARKLADMKRSLADLDRDLSLLNEVAWKDEKPDPEPKPEPGPGVPNDDYYWDLPGGA